MTCFTLTVTEVAGYACWGVAGGQVGLVHCYEWSWERPIPEGDSPKTGDQLQVNVFRVVNQTQESLPLDVTFGSRIKVDFAASVKLLRSKPQPKLPELEPDACSGSVLSHTRSLRVEGPVPRLVGSDVVPVFPMPGQVVPHRLGHALHGRGRDRTAAQPVEHPLG